MKIFSGSANKPLAQRIAKALGKELAPLEIFVFPDGERRVQIQERVVDEDCIIVQPTSTPVDQNYMELFFIADGLKRSGARSITAVVPYLGYQRQDHIFRDGEAVSLDVIVETLQAVGIQRIVAFDLHSIKIPEEFKIPVTHLSALPIFAGKIKEIIDTQGLATPYPHPTSLVSPDMGGLRRIRQISELLGGMPWIATVKDRDLDTGEIVIKSIEGELGKSTRQAFIVDDMISSGGTMIKSAQLLKKKGVEEVFVFATHAVFSQEAPQLLQESEIDGVYVTDSVFVPKEKYFPKLQIVSIARMIGEALEAL